MALVIIILFIIIVLGSYKLSKGAKINDDNKIYSIVTQYIQVMEGENAEITYYGDIIKKDGLGMIGVMAKCKIGNAESVYCVYLKKDTFFKSHYYVAGAQTSECGVIISDSQRINNSVIVFVRGLDLDSSIKKVSIADLKYENEVQNDYYFDIFAIEPSRYEVDIN